MNDLKPGWKRVKFGEVVRLNKETCKDPEAAGINRVIGLEHLEPGDLRVRSWADVADGTTFSNRVRPGQVLFGKRRAYQRKVAVADFDAICSGDIYVFETADQTQLLQELLPYICQTDSFFEYAVGTSAGSLSPRTNWKSLAAYEFALPPQEEQRRILAALRAIEEILEASRKSVLAAERVLEATAFHVFGQLLRDETVSKEPLHTLTTGDVRNGIFRKQEEFGHGLPLINVTDIYQGFRVNPESLSLVSVSEQEYGKYSAQSGDVIFNRSSLVLSGIGHACLVPLVHERLVFECHLMRVRPKPNRLIGVYLARFALSPWGRRHFLSRARTTTMTTIDQSDLESLLVPVPSKDTQSSIAELLDECESAISMACKNVRRALGLKASLLRSTGLEA